MEEDFDFESFQEAARPAIAWLYAHGDPHQSTIIGFDEVHLVGDLASIPTFCKWYREGE